MRRTNRILGYALAATAFVACPCHLAVTLPLALGLLGGTALGAVVISHTGLLVGAATVYFVGALAAALYILNGPSRDEEYRNCALANGDGRESCQTSLPQERSRSGVGR
jgi:mercuric ion transport protein